MYDKTPVKGDSFHMWIKKKQTKTNTDHWGGQSEKKTLRFHFYFISQTCKYSAITWQLPDKGRLYVLLKKTQQLCQVAWDTTVACND